MKRIAIAAFSIVLILTLARQAAVRAGGNAPAAEAGSSVNYVGTLLVQLRVADLERSVAFYRDKLGLRVQRQNDALRWVHIDTGIKGVTIGIGEGPKVEGSGSTSINLGVADIEAARATLEARGVVFLGPTMTVPDKVKLADLVDPDGNRLRLAQSIESDE